MGDMVQLEKLKQPQNYDGIGVGSGAKKHAKSPKDRNGPR